MPLNTASAATHITPDVIKTFYKHYRRKASKYADGNDEEEATDDILYDEAFNIVKSFMELGTHNTVESLQEFTNTHILSPPWAAISPLMIPLGTCNVAADLLVEWFSDPGELKNVVGGEKWWQVRGMDGIEAEWVTEGSLLNSTDSSEEIKRAEEERGRPLMDAEENIVRMNSLLETVMLYIHGGGYFFGSINTHRYQIVKYARKMRGKVFAVNYRKAPQYPWPCALLDCLAAYLYLIDPPPQAFHSAISPEKIVVAGDSAGGGLCLALLTVLRDLGRPLPAGGVLISPWVDLTHSFPSVMENTKTDIIPPHGFVHKPSLLWPIDPRPGPEGRIIPSKSSIPPKPGHADTLIPGEDRVNKEATPDGDGIQPVLSQKEMLEINGDAREANQSVYVVPGIPYSETPCSRLPKPPKILMDDPNAVPLELRSQIQLYCTNEQLTHPLVSSVLQGSLGNLCPLYIIAGNNECLRDEIIYLAHRAAYPEEFPSRKEAIEESPRQMENVRKFTRPTKVHLQVFDGMCHVLTVFIFHTAVKYAYRSIASFVRHVTENPTAVSQGLAFPELMTCGTNLSSSSSTTDSEESPAVTTRIGNGLKSLSAPLSIRSKSKTSTEVLDVNRASTKEHIQEYPSLTKLASQEAGEAGGSGKDGPNEFSNVVMIRERVDISGHVRPMEDKKEICCLRLNEMGLLREAPARRWQSGQQQWDERFKDTAKKVEGRRKKNVKHYEKTLARARELGLVQTSDTDGGLAVVGGTIDESDGGGRIQKSRRWGPLDLGDENPPPSAIVARRDTDESLALLKKTLYHTAPRTIKKMPKRKAKDVVKAAFSPDDDPSRAPRQSVSEQQHSAEVGPMHGLSLWASIMMYFTKRSSAQAVKGKHKTVSGLKKVKVGFTKRRSRAGSVMMDRTQSPGRRRTRDAHTS